MRKHGFDSFYMTIIEDGISADEIDNREMFYISKFNSKFPYGYNMTDGGDGMLNVSDDVRIAISNTMKSNASLIEKNTRTILNYMENETEEQRLMKLENFKRATNTVEYKEWQYKHLKKLRDNFTDDEAKQYQQMAALSRSKATLMLDVESNDIMMEFVSCRQAAEWISQNTSCTKASHHNIASVCRGKRNKAYGYKWKYK